MGFSSIKFTSSDGTLVDSISDIIPFEREVLFPQTSEIADQVDVDRVYLPESGILGSYSDVSIVPSESCSLMATRVLDDAFAADDGAVFRKYTTSFQVVSQRHLTGMSRHFVDSRQCAGVYHMSAFTEVRAEIPMIILDRDGVEITFQVGQTVSSHMGDVIIHHIEFDGSPLSWADLQRDYSKGLSAKDVYIWVDKAGTPEDEQTGSLRFKPDFLAPLGTTVPDPCPACQD
ncbi:MAG: hypothetical protein ABII18_11455 [bacterium]